MSGKTKAALAAELESAQQRMAELENALARQQTSTSAFEETLRWAQTRYRLLFEQAPTMDVITLLEEDQLVIGECNQRFLSRLGYARSEVIGHSMLEFYTAESRASFVPSTYFQALRGELPPLECQLRAREGQILETIMYTLPEIDDQGNVVAVRVTYVDITERKQAEAQLHQVTDTLEAIVQSSPLMIVVVDVNGRVKMWNPAAERILGWPVAEALGKAGPHVPADKVTEFHGLIARTFAGETITGLETQRVRRDGTRLAVSVSTAPLRDAAGQVHSIMAIMADITERKRAEEEIRRLNESLEQRVAERTRQLEAEIVERQQTEQALRESEEKFRQLAENIHQVFFIFTIDFAQLIYVSPAYEEIWGQSCDSLYAAPTSFLDRVPPEDREHVFTALREWPSDGMSFVEYRLARGDGSIGWIWTSTFPVANEAGQVYRVACISEEVTERKRAEEEIRAALAREKELSDLKSRFISMASHEFRTPLSTITSSAELLELYGRQWPEEKQTKHLQRIQTSVKYMANLLDDVLTISRADAGRIEFNPIPLNLERLCCDIIEDIQLGPGAKHTLVFACEGNCSNVAADEKLLRQIVLNLVSNAVKYSSPSSTVRCDLACSSDLATIRIQDQGLGIPREELPHMFEPFYRARNVGTISGTGLGLTIVKRAIDLHYGSIALESDVGVGTTVTVALPLKHEVTQLQAESAIIQ